MSVQHDGNESSPIKNRIILIGRGPTNDIVLRNPSVSIRHARVIVGDSGLVLEDLGSRNGTFVGSPPKRITNCKIQFEDPLTFGDALLPANALKDCIERTSKQSSKEKTIFLEDDSLVTFGRGKRAAVSIEQPLASSLHASVSVGKGKILVRDLGSMTGTFVNGRRIEGSVEIDSGALVQIADRRYRLSQDKQALVPIETKDDSIEAVNVEVSTGNGKRQKTLIHDVSFVIQPGELVAVMGPSGAGKSTLLSIVNGQAVPSRGQVIIGGLDLHDHFELFRGRIGFVPQDDILHADLTVWQALWYAARLRLPADTTDDEIEARIKDVIHCLGLEGTEHTRVGDQRKRGISGGQRKRVNLAMELLTDPPILILDEPTSGLSSTDALAVIQLLRNLSNDGKTIIVTIHQPSLDSYKLFDAVAVIARDVSTKQIGRLAYFGRAWPDAITFFEPMPPGSEQPQNVDGLLRGLDTKPVAKWVTQWKMSASHSIWVDGRSGKHPESLGHQARLRPKPMARFTQWKTLVQRSIAAKMSDRWNTIVLIAQAPLIAGLIAAVFSGVLRSTPSLEDWPRSSLDMATTMFVMALAAIWFGCSGTAREVVNEWPVYRRERMVGLSVLSYLFSKITVLAILTLLQTLMLTLIVGWGCGLQASAWHHWLVLELAALTGGAIGLVVSASLSTSEAAAGVLPVLLLPMIVLGGILVPIRSLPSFVQPAAYAMPSRWAFEGLVVPEALSRPRIRQSNQQKPIAVSPENEQQSKKNKKRSPFHFVSSRRPNFILPGRRRIAEELQKAASQAESKMEKAQADADRKAVEIEKKIRADIKIQTDAMQNKVEQLKNDLTAQSDELGKKIEEKVKNQVEAANQKLQTQLKTMQESMELKRNEMQKTLEQLKNAAGMQLVAATSTISKNDKDMAERFFPKNVRHVIQEFPTIVLGCLFCIGITLTGAILWQRDRSGR